MGQRGLGSFTLKCSSLCVSVYCLIICRVSTHELSVGLGLLKRCFPALLLQTSLLCLLLSSKLGFLCALLFCSFELLLCSLALLLQSTVFVGLGCTLSLDLALLLRFGLGCFLLLLLSAHLRELHKRCTYQCLFASRSL